MLDPLEVCKTMHDMLPTPSSFLNTGSFSRSGFPLKVLFYIAGIFGLDSILDDILAQVFIRDHDPGEKSITSQAWFTFFLGLGPSFTRSVIERFRHACSLPSLRAGNVDAIATPPATDKHIRAPGRLPLVRSQQTHGPITGLTNGAVDFVNRFNLGHESGSSGNLWSNMASGDIRQCGPARSHYRSRNSQSHYMIAHELNLGSKNTRKAIYMHQQFSG